MTSNNNNEEYDSDSEPVCSSCKKNEISYDGDICRECAFRTCGICQHQGWYDEDDFDYGENDEGEGCDVCGACYVSSEDTEIELKRTEIESAQIKLDELKEEMKETFKILNIPIGRKCWQCQEEEEMYNDVKCVKCAKWTCERCDKKGWYDTMGFRSVNEGDYYDEVCGDCLEDDDTVFIGELDGDELYGELPDEYK